MSVSVEARKLYESMLTQPSYTYSQAELEELIPEDKKSQLVEYLRELMQQQQVKLLQETDGTLFYRAIAEQEAMLIRGMSADEAMVYSYVQASGREGIWTKTIRIRSGLHQHVVNRCLKSLETKRITKSIKSVKFPTRKIVMLYHLQPSIEVTGGPWFSDTELDVEFVNLMLNVVWKFVCRRTFGSIDVSTEQASQIPGQEKYPPLPEIHEFIEQAKLSTVELSESDIYALLEVLISDNKVERTLGGEYRATWQSVLEDQGREQDTVPTLVVPDL